jgi:hypothetical protein
MLTGQRERLLLERVENALPPDQSILGVWRYLRLLAARMLVCSGLSSVVVMRQEMRLV